MCICKSPITVLFYKLALFCNVRASCCSYLQVPIPVQVWEGLVGQAFGQVQCVCVCVCVRACACVCACVFVCVPVCMHLT